MSMYTVYLIVYCIKHKDRANMRLKKKRDGFPKKDPRVKDLGGFVSVRMSKVGHQHTELEHTPSTQPLPTAVL